jgi:UDP-glucuronate 4-epimerase
MKILVTGGAGFIGSSLCEKLIDLNHSVFCLDNFCDFYSPKIKENNISTLLENKNFKLYRNDIRDLSQLDKIFSENNFELLIHLAAMAGVRPSIENPLLYTEVNVNGTLNILEMCRKYHVKKMIFASSSSVYGNSQKVPFSESDNVDYPISPYAATKKSGELLCYNYHHLYDLSVICLRFFTVYGPKQRPDLAIHKFAKAIIEGKSIPVFGDGSTQRDYTYIDDIIDGITKSINYINNNKVYEIFNLGESQTISLNEMISTIEKHLNLKAIKEFKNKQPGDVERTFADISKSRKILNYDPKTSFSDGIKKFIAWLNKKDKMTMNK